MAWVDAMNDHNLLAVEASMTSTARMVFLSEDGVQDGAFSGSALTDFNLAMFNDGIHLEVLSDPVVSNGTQVWTVVQMTRGEDDTINHTIFHLDRTGRELTVDVVMVVYEPPSA